MCESQRNSRDRVISRALNKRKSAAPGAGVGRSSTIDVDVSTEPTQRHRSPPSSPARLIENGLLGKDVTQTPSEGLCINPSTTTMKQSRNKNVANTARRHDFVRKTPQLCHSLHVP